MTESRVFRARALAQAHPFSPGASRYVDRTVARERTSQPQAEIGIWAGHALTVGYCLRRVAEGDAIDGTLEPVVDDFDRLDAAASELAAAIRTTGAEHLHHLPEKQIIADLDAMIAGEIERRLDHWKGTVDDDTWRELEEYVAWWVVKGYALRAVETGATLGADAP